MEAAMCCERYSDPEMNEKYGLGFPRGASSAHDKVQQNLDENLSKILNEGLAEDVTDKFEFGSWLKA